MNYFNYFTEIEELFVKRRGKHLMLGPLDWALMESWKDAEIPLKIVLRGINNVFDSVNGSAKKPESIKSLSYCKDEVETLFAEWRSMQTGKHIEDEVEVLEIARKEPNELEKLKVMLSNVRKDLPSGLARSIQGIIECVDKIDFEKLSIDEIEHRLSSLELTLNEALLKNAPPEILMRVEVGANASLQTYAEKLNENEFDEMRQKLVLKGLRKANNIPRLSLYGL